jgi:hypothetical protein
MSINGGNMKLLTIITILLSMGFIGAYCDGDGKRVDCPQFDDALVCFKHNSGNKGPVEDTLLSAAPEGVYCKESRDSDSGEVVQTQAVGILDWVPAGDGCIQVLDGEQEMLDGTVSHPCTKVWNFRDDDGAVGGDGFSGWEVLKTDKDAPCTVEHCPLCYDWCDWRYGNLGNDIVATCLNQCYALDCALGQTPVSFIPDPTLPQTPGYKECHVDLDFPPDGIYLDACICDGLLVVCDTDLDGDGEVDHCLCTPK